MEEETQLVSTPLDMPPEIAKAIVGVMAQIKTLTKDEVNKFQKYNYVSVDQFYDLVGRLMAGAGIFLLPFEKSMETSKRSTTNDSGVTKESMWLIAIYDLYIYHESGARFGPVERSITVLANGSQAYASSVSFVEKYFLRSLFKIPTGEGESEIDARPKNDLPADAKDEDLDACRSFFDRAKREWSTKATRADMTTWWKANKQAMADVYKDKGGSIYAELKEAFAKHGGTLPEVFPASSADQKEPPKTDAKSAAPAQTAKPHPDLPVDDDIPF